jgi:adenine-specific DNA-methyltransferase
VTIDSPERFDLATTPPADERIVALKELFPEVVREGRIDFEALQRSLGDWVDPGAERFGLTWPGKAECMRVIQQPSIGTLVPMTDESVEWDATGNVIIEGENLEVLKLLQKAYYGRVKLIYIDPPYNTGKEFIYPDNFKEGLTDYLRYSGQVDEEGFKLTANAETDGRYHSKWLSMMYPRLFLARNLLREDGFILVSIDDHEVQNLRLLMNEIFGEENFVASMVWQGGRKNDSKLVSSGHDYILVYARNQAHVTALDLQWEERKDGLDEIYAAAKEIRRAVGDDLSEAHKRLVAWSEVCRMGIRRRTTIITTTSTNEVCTTTTTSQVPTTERTSSMATGGTSPPRTAGDTNGRRWIVCTRKGAWSCRQIRPSESR